MARSRNRAIVQQQVALRKKLWPQIEDKDLWLRNERTGFVTMPRAMPYLLTIMDGMNKGKRVSSTYLDLWCRVMDEMFLQIQSPANMAHAAGFEGERGVRTWRERMLWLRDHGFIDFKPGPSGEMSYAIILNPYHVIRRHFDAKYPGITEGRYIALMARVNEIRAEDLDEDLPDHPLKRPPPPPPAPPPSFAKDEMDDEIPF
ncbi:MAG TPA: hypothetical protein VHC39_10290 [Rhizomicrobium sp.]|nr:hypothetical protein [Rhizomicrobium sp.]